jgi:5-(carboxyamino)imidazole ribonucleotide mutase
LLNSLSMPKEKIVVLMGSKSDYDFAKRVQQFLEKEDFPVKCEFDVASAHKTTEKLLGDLAEYEKSGDNIVFITVAGLSDALSGVVAGYSRYPVIACPPDSEILGWAKTFSSTMMPKGIAVAFVASPENAALAALKILALSNPQLQKKISKFKQRLEKSVYEATKEVRGKQK